MRLNVFYRLWFQIISALVIPKKLFEAQKWEDTEVRKGIFNFFHFIYMYGLEQHNSIAEWML